MNYSGVGKDLVEARKPYIKEIKKQNLEFIVVLNMSIQLLRQLNRANPYDSLVSFDDVKDLRTKCDYLVVLYHGGKEYYRLSIANA